MAARGRLFPTSSSASFERAVVLCFRRVPVHSVSRNSSHARYLVPSLASSSIESCSIVLRYCAMSRRLTSGSAQREQLRGVVPRRLRCGLDRGGCRLVTTLRSWRRSAGLNDATSTTIPPKAVILCFPLRQTHNLQQGRCSKQQHCNNHVCGRSELLAVDMVRHPDNPHRAGPVRLTHDNREEGFIDSVDAAISGPSVRPTTL